MARRTSAPSPAIVLKQTAPAPARTPGWLQVVIVLAAAFAFMTHTTREVSDNDTWWHLKTGQYILQQHKMPVPDQFAYTTYSRKPVLRGQDAARDFNLTHE